MGNVQIRCNSPRYLERRVGTLNECFHMQEKTCRENIKTLELEVAVSVRYIKDMTNISNKGIDSILCKSDPELAIFLRTHFAQYESLHICMKSSQL